MKTYTARFLSQKQRGLSLIELLIAMVLSLAVIVALSSVYVVAKQSFRFQETTGRMQEDGAYAMEFISKEMRSTGYAGCTGISSVVTNTTTTPPTLAYYPAMVSIDAEAINGLNPMATVYPTDTEVATRPFIQSHILRGFDSGPDAMFAAGNIPTWAASSGSIFFAGTGSDSASLAAPMTSATSDLLVSTNTFGWSGRSSMMIISDCSESTLFKGAVTEINPGSAAQLNISHAAGTDNTAASFANSKVYGTDAVVMTAQWNFLYVATRAGASTPSLYRVYFNGFDRRGPEEIVANVESMAIHYGEAVANPLIIDNWRTSAASVTDWSRVAAVRIGLMMVSPNDNANAGVTASAVTLLGQAYSVPSGQINRTRKEFSTTIVLRNRVAAR
jgi:type IV pilus assembly protein PilW